jgi:hypothetical protein
MAFGKSFLSCFDRWFMSYEMAVLRGEERPRLELRTEFARLEYPRIRGMGCSGYEVCFHFKHVASMILAASVRDYVPESLPR